MIDSTIRDVHSRLAELSPERRRLLELLLKDKGIDLGRSGTIPRRGEEGLAPLSFSQQRLWFLDQLEPGSSAYNIPSAVRVEGALDLAIFACCLGEVVRRHEILRTTFHAVQGEPLQVVEPLVPLPLHLIDLAGLAEEARGTELRRIIGVEADRPFDLATGPLLRVLAVLLEEQDHGVLLTMHHIISDHWSHGVLLREIGQLYPALAMGGRPALPELPIQYADFAVWQRAWLSGEVLDEQIAYWRQQLDGAPEVLDLPIDRPRPAFPTFRGATWDHPLPGPLAVALHETARREGGTVFMVLLAGFQALLARYSGQDDLTVGTPVAGRSRAETEGLIGFFVNTLVMRARFDGDPVGGELLARVRATCLGAYSHQDLPLERLVEELAPVRSLAHAPLFQVMFALQSAAPIVGGDAGPTMRALATPVTTAKFDLTLSVVDAGVSMLTSLEFATDLFEAATIRRFASHLEHFVAGLASHPERRLGDLPLLSDAETAQLLQEWNGTRIGESCCVQDLFEACVAYRPERTALVSSEQSWTYSELNERVNHLAWHLRRLGVGPEVRVGLALESSPDAIVGLLAILKAGGAYVPLDPVYPQERLAYMIEDSELEVLISVSRLADRLPEHRAALVLLDRDAGLIAQESSGNPERTVSPGHLAYVMYTSGSTGRSKGVLVEHRCLAWYAQTAALEYGLGAEDRALQYTSISFDISVEEIFPCLTQGGAVVVRNTPMTGSVTEFFRQCGELGVSGLFLPTAFWHELSAELAAGVELPESLRVVSFGGEKVLPERVDAWSRRVGPRVRLFNSYGPTETTVVAALYPIAGQSSGHGAGREIPIGRPIHGTRTFVLDRWGSLAPIGVAGELHIGGAGVTRGYLGRPDLTADRFVPDSWSGIPGGRLYRTADLVRWLPEGHLEFLGRTDDQVKVRGFRVDPGEVESALAEYPEAAGVAVAVRRTATGKRLVAYVAAKPGRDVTAEEIGKFLRLRLPEHMVPSAIVLLERLPLTPNGKVDRRALPEPQENRERPAALLPRTPVEEVLAGIWTEVLGVERIAVDDDFFVLGGHSLLATRANSRIRQLFGVELALRELFESSSLGALARRIDALLGSYQDTEIPILRAVPRDRPLPLSFAQERLWFLDQLEPENPFYNIPFFVRIRGLLSIGALAASLDAVVCRHEVLRTRFEVLGGSPVQVIVPAALWQLSVIDLSDLPSAAGTGEASRLAAEESRRGFDLRRGPVLRSMLVRLAEAEHLALLTLHHIAGDAWSADLILQEISQNYRALSAGRPALLPELPIQYADYADWQRHWMAGTALDRQILYWRERLAGAPPLLELPTDRGRRCRPTGGTSSRAASTRDCSPGSVDSAEKKEPPSS